ncbi:hypothetical protein PL10110_600070 [Planktothrix agardhii]|nr:hypothetical protein PL10110_600070 [Planktothrix agardhii]
MLRKKGTPEQPPQTPRARGARGGGNRGCKLFLLPITHYLLPIT